MSFPKEVSHPQGTCWAQPDEWMGDEFWLAIANQ
ncbi:hypothetical protein HNR34_002403 [Geobacillus subterraneus]